MRRNLREAFWSFVALTLLLGALLGIPIGAALHALYGGA